MYSLDAVDRQDEFSWVKPCTPALGRQITTVPGIAYAPLNELGVVFLFGRLAPQLGFCVEAVRPQFPDCVATRKGKRYRIEFEFWASSFGSHRHSATDCDLVVCWENDWATRPKKYQRLEIVSLKSLAGALPRVFVVGCDEATGNSVELKGSRVEWNLPSRAQLDDVVLMYRSRPTSAICDIWKVVGPFRWFAKHNDSDRWPGRQGGLRRIVALEKPLTYSKLVSDPRTKNLPVVRSCFQGKQDVTEDWPALYQRIVALNPTAKNRLRPYVFL